MIEDIKVNRILKKDLTIEKYNELNESIRNRKEIIDHLIECNMDKPNKLIECLDKFNLNQFFKKLDISKITITKEIIDKLYNSNVIEIIKYDLIKYLNCVGPSQLCRVLYARKNGNFNISDGEILYAISKELNDDKIREYILNLSDAEVKVFNSKYYMETMKEVISNFSYDVQLQFYEHCHNIFDLLSKDIQDIIECNNIGDNIALLKNQNEQVRLLFYEKNPHLLKVADLNDKIEYYKKHKNDKDFDFWSFFLAEPNYNYFDFNDEQIASLMQADYKRANLRILSKDFDTSFDKTALPKMLKNNIKIILANLKDYNIKNIKKIIESYINIATKIGNDNEFLYATRILFNKKIIINNDAELICNFIEKPNMSLFIQLLTNAYGEHVKNIFDKRPELYYEDIRNLEIFDKNIYETFGEDFINFYLNATHMKDVLIYLLANDERRRKIFAKYFDFYRTNLEVFDLNAFSNLLLRYHLFEPLFEILDVNTLKEDEKKNLIVMFSDNKNVVACINNREKLNKYNEYRKKILGSYYFTNDEKMLNVLNKKDYLIELLTGRTVVNENRNTVYYQTLEELSIENIVKVFNIKNIIHNPKIIELIGLNSKEVALLLLLYEILHYFDGNNKKALDNVMNFLLYESSLEPYIFISVFNKIKNYYIKEFKGSLTIVENMPTTQVEGINVVNLQGEPYNLLCSVIGLNLKTESERKKIYGKELLYDWLNREHSHNTISTYLQTSDISVYPMELDIYNSLPDKPIIFAFDSNVDVIAMGGSDISTATDGYSIGFGFIQDTKIGFSDMEQLKENIVKSLEDTPGKFKSEIAIKRANDKLYTKNFNKRVMPIGIYVIGEITNEELETAKIFQEYYRKNNLGDFKIIRVDSLKYPNSAISVNKPKEEQTMVSSDVEWYQQIHNLLDEGGKSERRR